MKIKNIHLKFGTMSTLMSSPLCHDLCYNIVWIELPRTPMGCHWSITALTSFWSHSMRKEQDSSVAALIKCVLCIMGNKLDRDSGISHLVKFPEPSVQECVKNSPQSNEIDAPGTFTPRRKHSTWWASLGSGAAYSFPWNASLAHMSESVGSCEL